MGLTLHQSGHGHSHGGPGAKAHGHSRDTPEGSSAISNGDVDPEHNTEAKGELSHRSSSSSSSLRLMKSRCSPRTQDSAGQRQRESSLCPRGWRSAPEHQRVHQRHHYLPEGWFHLWEPFQKPPPEQTRKAIKLSSELVSWSDCGPAAG